MATAFRRGVLASLALVLGCAQARDAGVEAARRLNPVGTREAVVRSTTARGPYLVTQLGGRGAELAFFAPNDANCAQILVPEASVTYAKRGVFGRISRGDAHCDPVGIASLAAWRNRQPRRPGGPLPRRTVRFAVIHRDADVVLVRGRFPLVGRVGIPAGYDLVAMLPNDDACRAPIERGEASMEFVASGPVAFRLIGAGRLCPVLGFATPLAGPDPAP